MARQTINIGSAPNDGTGDALRVAFDKINDNFLEVYDDGGANITVNNPVTSTETTLDVALSDLVGGGGATPNLNEVVIAGGTAVSTDEFSFVNFELDNSLASFNWLMRKDATDKQTTMYSNPNTIYLLSQTPTKDAYVEVLDGEFSIRERVLGVDDSTTVNFEEPTNTTILKFPAKAVDGTYTIATLDDITGGATDLAYTPSPTNGIVTSSTGTDATLPLADATDAGLLKPADFTQLSTLATDLANINTDAVDKVTVKLALGITKGQAVYISSATGTNIIVSKASNTSEATSSKTLGLLATTGVTNDIVEVVTSGLLDGLNTSTATIGDPVWLGTSGNLIYGLASKPVAPAHLVYIGVVSRVHATVGEIFVRPQNGFELKEIHDVLITSVVDNQVLNYDSASLLWKNKTLANSDVGLGNVDNTSDVNKPVSTATQTALDLKEVLSDVGRLSSDYTLSNVATAQKIFNIGSSGNGSFNALGSTLYEIELFVNLASLSSTSGFFSFSLGGTATYTDLQLDLFASKAALISGAFFFGVITSASAFQCTTSNANTVGTIKIKGLINVNGAGTIIPTITLSQASAGVVKKNSYFVFRKIGASSFTASSNII